jgi:carbonic anhydrase
MTMPHRESPAAALSELLSGNDRFVTSARLHPNQDAEYRATLTESQSPFAVVFGCSDSRLAAEIIFDRGLGDLFVVRTAGHVIGPEVLASIDYGVVVLGVPLVVVLGHDSCGAVAAAMTADRAARHELPPGVAGLPVGVNLSPIVDRVRPSVEQARHAGITDPDDVSVIHVRRTMDELMMADAPLATAVAEGRCAVVGMSYRLTDGRVTVLDRFFDDGAQAA